MRFARMGSLRMQPLLGTLAAAMLFTLLSATRSEAAVSCANATGESAVTVCQKELERSPNDADLRLKLADALIGLARFREAVEVLKRGVILQPGNNAFKQRMSAAESYLAEGEWIKKREASKDSSNAGSQAAADAMLCSKLRGEAAIEACDAVLARSPGNKTALVAKADALSGMGRFQDAIVEYRRVLRIFPQDADVAKKLHAAESRTTTASRVPATRTADIGSPGTSGDSRVSQAPAIHKAPPQVAVARTISPVPAPRDDARSPSSARTYSNAPLSRGVTF